MHLYQVLLYLFRACSPASIHLAGFSTKKKLSPNISLEFKFCLPNHHCSHGRQPLWLLARPYTLLYVCELVCGLIKYQFVAKESISNIFTFKMLTQNNIFKRSLCLFIFWWGMWSNTNMIYPKWNNFLIKKNKLIRLWKLQWNIFELSWLSISNVSRQPPQL